MRNTILIFFLLYTSLSSIAKSRCACSRIKTGVNYIDSIAISYISLNSNSLLFREIRKYIRERSDSSTLFKSGFGFIVVDRVRLFSHIPVQAQDVDKHKKDVLTTFDLSTASYPLSDAYSLTRFPTYYTIVDSRPVLFYDELLEWISRPAYKYESKEKVKKLVLNSLQKVFEEDFVFYNPLQRKSFTLNKEQRKTISEREVFELASLSIAHSRMVTEYYDHSVSYSP